MARRSAGPNTAQGTGQVSSGRRRRKPRTFNWDDGRGKVHSRAKRTPQQRQAATPAKPKPDPYKGALYDPTAVLSGKTLGRAADRLVNLEFDPQRHALDRAESQATAQGTALVDRAGTYYNDLASSARGDVERQQAIGDRLQQALKGIGDETQATMRSAADAVSQRAAEDETLRGPGLGGGGEQTAADELAAQRSLAAQENETAQENAVSGTADYANLQNLTAGATAARGGEIRQQLLNRIANQRADLQGQRTDLEGQAAGKRTEQLLNLRQTGLENLVAMEGLGIKRADLQAQIANDTADRQLAARRQRATEKQNRRQARLQARGQDVTRRGQDVSAQTQRRGQDISARERAADRRVRQQIAAGKAKPHTNESTDSRKQRLGIANAVEDINAGHKKRVERDAPPLVKRAAKQIAASGFLGPETIRQMRAAGIRIPRSWLPPGKKGSGAAGYNKGNVPG